MIHRISTLSYFVFLEAIRSKFYLLVIIAALVGLFFGSFAESLSITEGEQIQSALIAALLRITVVFSLCLFVVTTMSRETQDQSLDMILATRVTRTEYYLGKMLGFACVALLITGILTVFLLTLAPANQVLLWAVSLFFELLIIISFALFCSVSFENQPLAIFMVMGFYLLARSIVAIELIAQSPTIVEDSLSQQFMPMVVSAIASLLPDFSSFTRTEWLVYQTGQWSELFALFLQTAIYVSLLLFAGLIDFYRKNV